MSTSEAPVEAPVEEILPAGTYAHPETGEPLTLGEWSDSGERVWGSDEVDLAADVWGISWFVYRPGLGMEASYAVAEGSVDRDAPAGAARNAADLALRAWLRVGEVGR